MRCRLPAASGRLRSEGRRTEREGSATRPSDRIEADKAARRLGKSSKLDALTSLRFVAAFAIVIEHSRGAFLPTWVLVHWPLDQAVSFFFVLSGFILVHVYPELTSKQATARFWVARFARIWPAHIVALLLLLFFARRQLHVLLGTDSAVVLAANVLLIHAWIPLREFYFSFNAVSWTISTEAAFYLLFPLLIGKFGSTWPWKLAGAAGALIGLAAICTIWRLPGYRDDYQGVTTHGLLYINPLARLFEFVVGMCTAVAWRRFLPRVSTNLLIWTAAEVLAFGFTLWSLRYGTFDAVVLASHSPIPALSHWLVHAGACLSFAILIWTMASGTGLIGRLLCLAPLIFLGEISYSLYLLHQVLIFGYFSDRARLPPVPSSLHWLMFLAVLLAASSFTLLAIERPSRVGIRRLGERLSASRGGIFGLGN